MNKKKPKIASISDIPIAFPKNAEIVSKATGKTLALSKAKLSSLEGYLIIKDPVARYQLWRGRLK